MENKVIKSKDKIIALVFFNQIKAEGVKFLTPFEYTLQLGLIEHQAGKKVRDHIHNQKIKYKVDTTQEFLYIEKGRVKVNLFDDRWIALDSLVLSSGDFILFTGGGHGLEVLEDCRIIEIKQGPYPGDQIAKIYKEE